MDVTGQYKRISERIAVFVHHIKVPPAKTGLIGHLPYIAFHIRRTGTDGILYRVIFKRLLGIADRAFIIRINGIIDRYGI